MTTLLLARPAHLRIDIDDDLTRRRFLGSGAALGAGLLIGGCADEEGEPLVASTPTPTRTRAFEFAGDDGVEVRLDGIPDNVVAWMPTAATLRRFGVRVSGVWGPTELARGEDVANLPNYEGEEFLVDVERLAGARPDLILGTLWNGDFSLPQQEEFDNVKAIAPMVRLESNSSIADMIAAHERLAVALGLDPADAALQAAKAEFAAARTDLRAATAENPDLQVVCLALMDENVFVSYLDQATLRDLRDLGVNILDNTEGDEAWDNGFSWELVPTLKADLIMWDQRPRFRTPDDLADHPIFSRLPAVEAGQLVPYPFDPLLTYDYMAEVYRSMTEAVRDAKKVI